MGPILICSRDTLLAASIADAVGGDVCYAGSMRRARELVPQLRPVLVLLDVRAGGNTERAVDSTPMLKEEGAEGVVIVTEAASHEEVQEAASLGAYSWADRARVDFYDQLRRAVTTARWARRRAHRLP